MRFRHASTLVLIGWYLMLPPPMASNHRLPDTNAPLSGWTHLGTYHQPGECHAARTKIYRKAEKSPPTVSNRFFKDQIAASQCVATNDPRLKGN
jgi:hypothetical protein